MRNFISKNSTALVFLFWLTVILLLTSCASGSGYGACAAYASVDVEICEQ